MNISSKLTCGVALAALAVAVGCGPNIPVQTAADAEQVAKIRKVLLEGGAQNTAVAVALPDPQGFGTLTGTFRVDQSVAGQLANRPALNVTGGDASFCNSHGALKSEAVMVDGASGALQDVIVYLADDLSKVEKPELWFDPAAKPGNTEPVVFDQKDCMFLSHVFPLQVSQPMEIHNSDEKSHNTYLQPQSNAPFNQTIGPGSVLTYQHTKEERGPYKATCSVHPWMNAWILPRNNGYFALSAKDGKFTIPNLPAGVPLTFKAWQAKANFIKSVTVNGKKENWPSKGFQLTIPAGGTTNLDIVVDAQPLM